MGTWGHGPLDNDTAADWCGNLHDATPANRLSMVEAALSVAVDHGEHVDIHAAQEAIAAATIVASQRPYGPPMYTAYGPDFLREGGSMEVDHLVPLAARALDRVIGVHSEWRELWEESGVLAEALESLAPLRATLTG